MPGWWWGAISVDDAILRMYCEDCDIPEMYVVKDDDGPRVICSQCHATISSLKVVDVPDEPVYTH